MSNTEPTTQRLVLDYLLAYASWLVLLVIAMWLVFVWQSILVTIGLRMGLNLWQLRAVDTWGTFLLVQCGSNESTDRVMKYTGIVESQLPESTKR